jgi:ankyrin repeat protein
MNASAAGYEDVVDVLIEHGADVNLADVDGRTALMHAAAGKYVDAIPHLIAAGANLFAKDRAGDTALDLARKSPNAAAFDLLFAHMNAPPPAR